MSSGTQIKLIVVSNLNGGCKADISACDKCFVLSKC